MISYGPHLGDCLEVMDAIDDGSIDMILCDLPYGTTQCKWDTVIPFEPLWAQYKRIIKDNGAIVLTAAQPFTSALVMSNVKMFRYCWVWEKSKVTGVLNAKKQPLRTVEDVAVFYKKQCDYNPQGVQECNRLTTTGASNGSNSDNYGKVEEGKYRQTQTGYPRQVLKIPSAGKTKHPTQKPVALFEYLIKTYTNPGDVVLDNCAGSGTTGVACFNTGRKCIMIEQDEKYCKIIWDRLTEACLGGLHG